MKRDKFKPSLIGKTITIHNPKWPEDVWVGELTKNGQCDLGKTWYKVAASPQGSGKGKTMSFGFPAGVVRTISGTDITTG